MTKQRAISILHEMDPKIKTRSKEMTAGLILLAATEVGTSDQKIAKFLGMSPRTLSLYTSRLRKQKVFDGEKLRHSGWFSKKSGGIAFWLDASIALGYIERATP